jgi:hypothetical protein
MIERLEVTTGPGTVIRYGFVVAWASASASPSLVSFLAESARNLADSPLGGDQLAAHLAGVLARRDPEPHVPFVTIGPSEVGWSALLHGPVQVWDGVAWTHPEPHPGWIRASLSPRPGLSVSVSGAPVPNLAPDALLDLEAGVVPGGGFVLLPAVPAPITPTGVAAGPARLDEPTAVLDPGLASVAAGAGDDQRQDDEPEPTGPSDAAHLVTGLAAAGALAHAAGQEEDQAQPDGEPDAQPDAGEAPGAEADGAESAAEDRPSETPAIPLVVPAPDSAIEPPRPSARPGASLGPPGVLDLHDPIVRARVVPYPPLPPGGDPPRPAPGTPVVAGVPCRRGHLNRPGMLTCARCGQPIEAEGGYQISGTRPALGCLISDGGSVFGLDSGYLVGSDPGRDPTVRGRLARPLVIEGEDVAASHAEIRLHEWDVMVTDRGSSGGTHIYPPGATSWDRLAPYQPRVIPPGTHVAFGQRVMTFVSPWNLPPAAGSGPAEGSG